MTILGVEQNDVDAGRGLSSGKERVDAFDNCNELCDEELTIIAHSSEGFFNDKPKYIGGMDAKTIATKIAQKYGNNPQALKHLYLLSCEAGYWYEGQEPLAQVVLNELKAQGLTDVKVHAITPFKEVPDAGGQVVKLVTLNTTEPQTVIESYTFANSRLGVLQEKVDKITQDVANHNKVNAAKRSAYDEIKKELTPEEWEAYSKNYFRFYTSILSEPLTKDNYRSHLRAAHNTYEGERKPKKFYEFHAQLLQKISSSIQKLEDILSANSKKKYLPSSIKALKDLYQSLAKLSFESSDELKNKLIQGINATAVRLEASGTHGFIRKRYNYHHALEVINGLREMLGVCKQQEQSYSLLAKLMGNTPLQQYDELREKCNQLILKINALGELSNALYRRVEDMNQIQVTTNDEAKGKNIQLHMLQGDLAQFLEQLKVKEAEEQEQKLMEAYNATLEKIDAKLRLLDSHQALTNELKSFKSRRYSLHSTKKEDLGDAQKLLEDIASFERSDAVCNITWKRLQEKYFKLRNEILEIESPLVGPIELEDNTGIPQDLVGYDAVLTALNVMRHTFSSSLESIKDKSTMITEAENKIEKIERLKTNLEGGQYQAVLKLIEHFDDKSKHFFSFGCKRKANKLREAVHTLSEKDRKDIFKHQSVIDAIDYQRYSLFACLVGKVHTKSYDKLDKTFHFSN